MNLDIFKDNVARLWAQRNTVLILSVFLALSNVILSLAYVIKAERVVLVPPHIHKTFWVEEGRVSKEYLEEMALFMSQLLLDNSPSSYAYKRDILLRYTTPESYSSLKKQLFKEEKTYQELQLSTHFKPLEISASPETLDVKLTGNFVSFVAGQKVDEYQDLLLLHFVLRGGKLMLESFKGGLSHEK